ncbi:hypothetical protein [Nostoc sp. CHAB 5715]|nr:hypothetical protein [Nostoc sp. CHAB 5715]
MPIADFERIEEILENYGLVQLMKESEDEEPLSKDEAMRNVLLKSDRSTI